MLVLAVSTLTATTMWACGSSVTSETGSASGSGGKGGSAVTVTTSGSKASVTASASSGGNTLCDQACGKIKDQCKFGDLCSQFNIIDCKNPMADCPSKCIINAECSKIGTLLSMPDPDLLCCLQECQGKCDKCQTCVLSKCAGDLQTCNKDQKCKDFLACAQKCNQEQKCLGDCAAKNDSSATQALVACSQKNCTTACANTSGAGGAGGAGSGGAMGSGGMAGMGGSSI
jgi:hypothetical protein